MEVMVWSWTPFITFASQYVLVCPLFFCHNYLWMLPSPVQYLEALFSGFKPLWPWGDIESILLSQFLHVRERKWRYIDKPLQQVDIVFAIQSLHFCNLIIITNNFIHNYIFFWVSIMHLDKPICVLYFIFQHFLGKLTHDTVKLVCRIGWDYTPVKVFFIDTSGILF